MTTERQVWGKPADWVDVGLMDCVIRRRSRGRPYSYDWDLLFSQTGTVRLRYGVDYTCTLPSFLITLRNAATNRGVKIEIKCRHNSLLMRVVNPSPRKKGTAGGEGRAG